MVLALILAVVLAAGFVAGPGADRPAQPPRIAIVVLENHGYGEVVGSPEMPFFNGLAKRGALATRYRAITHPSLPNYLAMVGGSTFGIERTCTECTARGSNLALQLSRAGISWRAYFEDMPEACFAGAESGRYAKRHNPFMYFPSISTHLERCANVVPAPRLDADLRRGSLPAFAWIGPDVCHDAHDCSLAVADRWLSRLVPRVTAKLGRNGFLAVVFDEDAGGSRDGGHVPAVLVGPRVVPGKRLTAALDHYSLLATVEDAFGLPRLRGARGAPTLAGALR